jgi:hypothetical protein
MSCVPLFFAAARRHTMANSDAASVGEERRKRVAYGRDRVSGVRGAQFEGSTADNKDRFFDGWLITRGNKLRTIVGQVVARLDEAEGRKAVRKRQRRQVDLRTRQELVDTIVANLAYAVVDKSRLKTIAVSLSKAKKVTRYDRPIFRQLPAVLQAMDHAGVLRLKKSTQLGRLSTIRPTTRFEREVGAAGVTFDDFGHAPGEEVIILGRRVDGFRFDGTFAKQRRRIDYQDTAETRRYRAEMRRINEALAEADITLVPEPAKPLIDTSRRQLTRRFTLPSWQEDDQARFDLNGRLFGGWWEPLPKGERHRIRINGEPIVDLDYASMFARLAYARIGTEPPSGDLYALPGLEDPQCRDAVKGVMSSLFFVRGPKGRLPSEFSKQLPRGWTLAKVRAAILSHHPRLEPLLEAGIGLELMFTESQIMVTVLLRLIDQSVTALPMHDGLMVGVSKKDPVRKVMGEVGAKIAGLELPVTEKSLVHS